MMKPFDVNETIYSVGQSKMVSRNQDKYNVSRNKNRLFVSVHGRPNKGEFITGRHQSLNSTVYDTEQSVFLNQHARGNSMISPRTAGTGMMAKRNPGATHQSVFSDQKMN
jgi:hypothetical protein